MRTLLIIVAVIAALIGLTFLASRGGHESYKTEYFKPGPAIGLLKGLSDDALEGRKTGQPGSVRAQEMITSRMAMLELLKIGNEYRHPFTVDVETGEKGEDGEPKTKSVSGVNLIGGIQGSLGSDRLIVLTAHYDHLGIVDGEIYNGADDNASGVAALLAIAERYTRKRITPKHSLLFVITDAEEDALAGATAFVQNPPMPAEAFAFNLNLDMIARADNGSLWASGAALTPTLMPVLEDVSTRTPLTLKMGFDGSDPDQDNWTSMSDHYPFYEAGIPHLYLGVEDHPDYHQPSDTFAAIDQDTFLKSVDTILMVFEALDNNLETILGLPPIEEKQAS